MPPFATWTDVRTFLNETTDYEKMVRYRMKRGAFDLGRVERFFDALGAPHTAYESVHIAGTNGKGSTAWMIDALLRGQGISTGRYTSPHLERESERIVINGAEVNEDELLAVFNEMAPALTRFQRTGDALTYFEIMTGAALLAFSRAGVEMAVLEVGLGGRLDATNVVTPLVSVITSIDYDHMDKLGPTLTDIAYEKCGIIKEGVPLVTGSYAREALDYVLNRAKEMEIPARRLDGQFRVRGLQSTPDGISFTVSGDGYEHEKLRLPLAGQYQANNAAIALEVLHQLVKREFLRTVDYDAVARSLAELRIPGRCEMFGRVMLDCAHNAGAVKQGLRTFAARFKDRPKVLLFAVAADKDVESIVKILAEGSFEHVVLTEVRSPRKLDVDDLATMWQKFGARVEAVRDMDEAFERAMALTGPGDALLITGSFFLAGPLRARLA
ncbi:MAG: bifunctional folylpolyglutamate synthase/dihydrofolate synthase [Planctomycetes bacterium]|nr:bifunctional folylpolyglutamate synthase/dihydrofolate synthase [Planctomycetota bacterium]NUQ34917.1 bifunctional folylpolyglutamate synthase/dihydrofolate synthase [Planctomycetaceae bacterium]